MLLLLSPSIQENSDLIGHYLLKLSSDVYFESESFYLAEKLLLSHSKLHLIDSSGPLRVH